MKVRNVINTSRESVSSTLSPLNNNELTRSPLMSTNTYTPPDSFDIQASLREWLNNMSWEEYALLRKEDEQCIYSGSSNYPDSASNWELATRANTGRKRPEHSAAMKIKTKEYWDSPAGMEKRKRLSERNRQVKSEQVNQAWKDGKYKNMNHDTKIKYKPRCNDKVFKSVPIAANQMNMSESTIYYRCHHNNKGWSWV